MAAGGQKTQLSVYIIFTVTQSKSNWPAENRIDMMPEYSIKAAYWDTDG